ncbi:sugar transferase [Maribacter luteus]|uniref:sugar transferase n=1 Tax=Maribacter luteus TaxID=2594478 RepID=UPI0024901FEB|nr:sugar transferase [Maribacter luteus]
MNLAPILLFTYKKLEPLKLTIDALTKNDLASKSILYIFSDGPAKKEDNRQVDEVRSYIQNINGFSQVNLIISKTNKGLARSIIEGVSKILETSEAVIVLEDDLLTSNNFLTFTNKALKYYGNNPKILSIAGYTPPIKLPNDYNYDTYFTLRASSWGWATWRSKWEKVDWSVQDYSVFKEDRKAKRRFNQMGSDMSRMLNDQMNGKLSSWAIRWCYHQFKYGLYTVFPTVSKINNIGFGEEATHTNGKSTDLRFNTTLDDTHSDEFNFNESVQLDDRFVKQFVRPYSLRTRIYYKVRNILKV